MAVGRVLQRMGKSESGDVLCPIQNLFREENERKTTRLEVGAEETRVKL